MGNCLNIWLSLSLYHRIIKINKVSVVCLHLFQQLTLINWALNAVSALTEHLGCLALRKFYFYYFSFSMGQPNGTKQNGMELNERAYKRRRILNSQIQSSQFSFLPKMASSKLALTPFLFHSHRMNRIYYIRTSFCVWTRMRYKQNKTFKNDVFATVIRKCIRFETLTNIHKSHLKME